MSTEKFGIAVDTLGGDYAPREIIKGALQAAQGDEDINLVLIGPLDMISSELSLYAENVQDRIITVECNEAISEEEHPVWAIQRKQRSSIVLATNLLKERRVDAVVSMGSTGASLAAATLILGTFEGLERPCIGGPFLGLAPNTILVDIGSNVDCRPNLLLDFAAMGCAFARCLLGIKNPKVGLLSTGAESSKGSRQIQEAHQLFQNSTLNFVGNVEGYDFFTEKANVIVCDGLVGNVLLKFSEGLALALAHHIKAIMRGSFPVPLQDYQTVPAEILRAVAGQTFRRGAPLLGVKGVVVIGHGASKEKDVATAIETAKACLDMNLVQNLKAALATVRTA